MEDKYEATISFVIKKNDGNFMSSEIVYSDMDLGNIVELEEFVSTIVSQLVNMGKQKLSQKK